jgi:hypothetical protein
MREALSVGIVFLVLSSQAPVLATEDRLSKVETLPSTYALVDVSIEFAEGGARGGRSLEISGKGTGQSRSSWELKADEVTTFSVAPAAVFELLQLCYREQFFDLQSSYGVPNHIRLRPDGTIDTLATVVSHSISLLREGDVPAELQPDLQWIRGRLLKNEPKLLRGVEGGKVRQFSSGRLGATVPYMRIASAVQVAERICYVESRLGQLCSVVEKGSNE